MRRRVLRFAVFQCLSAASAFFTTFQRGGFTQASFLRPSTLLIVCFCCFFYNVFPHVVGRWRWNGTDWSRPLRVFGCLWSRWFKKRERGRMKAARRRGGTRRLRMYRLRGVTTPFWKSVLFFLCVFFFERERELLSFGVLTIGRSPPLLLTIQTARPKAKKTVFITVWDARIFTAKLSKRDDLRNSTCLTVQFNVSEFKV